MKIRRIISVIVMLLVTTLVQAQSGRLWVNRAVEHYKLGEMEKSKQAIEKALEFDEIGGDAYAWHFKGFIYKELFKSASITTERAEYRELAVKSILRSLGLDIPEQFLQENTKALDYLAVTFQNDSYNLANQISPENLAEAKRQFVRFKSLYNELYPDTNVTTIETDFYNTMGRGYNHLADSDNVKAPQYSQMAANEYEKVLSIDGNNYGATINLGITLYNQAVKKIRAINHETEIFELIMVQEECVELFKKSLPFFQRAYNLEPHKRLPLEALVAVHRSLNDPARADSYKDLLNELEAAGEIEE